MAFLTSFLIYLVFQLFYRMKKKTKLIISVSAFVIFLTISLFALKFIIDSSYRNQLPEYPDFQNIPKLLQKQISVANRKTYRNPSANNLGRLGMVYNSSYYYEKAAQCYQLAVKKNSGKWIWSYYLGYLNLVQGESNASIENFRHVIEKNPKNFLALFYTAEAYQNLGLSVNAKNMFKKIAALDDRDFVEKDTIRDNDFPLQTYVLFRLARIYMNSNRLDSAEITLKEIIENQMTFGPAYRLLGDVYTREGNLLLGNKYTIRANDLVEYTPPADMLVDKLALMSRSDTYLLKQIDDAVRSLNFNWALKLFDHALKYIPDNKFLLSKALYGYFNLGFDKKAIPYLDQHLKYFSDDFVELLLFATILHNKGFNSQAMNYFNQAKKLQPENSRLVLWLSDREMISEAIILLNEQLKRDPENVTILTDAVRMFSHLGDKEKAMTYFTNLKRILPSGPEVKKLTGEIDENEGNLKEAISIYEETLGSDPKNLFIIKHLVTIYMRDKMWDKLIHHYRLALDSYPNEPFLLEGLGRILISCPDTNLRNINEGREYSERAYINFTSPFATKISAGKNLAIAYAILGDKQNASKYINITINLARKVNVSQDFIPYFETLRKQYNIPN